MPLPVSSSLYRMMLNMLICSRRLSRPEHTDIYRHDQLPYSFSIGLISSLNSDQVDIRVFPGSSSTAGISTGYLRLPKNYPHIIISRSYSQPKRYIEVVISKALYQGFIDSLFFHNAPDPMLPAATEAGRTTSTTAPRHWKTWQKSQSESIRGRFSDWPSSQRNAP